MKMYQLKSHLHNAVVLQMLLRWSEWILANKQTKKVLKVDIEASKVKKAHPKSLYSFPFCLPGKKAYLIFEHTSIQQTKQQLPQKLQVTCRSLNSVIYVAPELQNNLTQPVKKGFVKEIDTLTMVTL